MKINIVGYINITDIYFIRELVIIKQISTVNEAVVAKYRDFTFIWTNTRHAFHKSIQSIKNEAAWTGFEKKTCQIGPQNWLTRIFVQFTGNTMTSIEHFNLLEKSTSRITKYKAISFNKDFFFFREYCFCSCVQRKLLAHNIHNVFSVTTSN